VVFFWVLLGGFFWVGFLMPTLFSGQVQLPSWQKERITAPARIPVKQEVIFEIKREVSEPTVEVGKTVEDPVKHRVKKHAIRMVVLRSVFCFTPVWFFGRAPVPHLIFCA
jgi:hypothetical protein